MHSFRTRRVGGAAALVVVLSACGSASDGDPADSGDVVVTIEESTDSEASDPAETEPSLPANIWPEEIVETSDADSTDVEVETAASLPANIWPEEIVETSDQETVDSKDVVTRSPDAVGDGVLPEGVSSITARVTTADGEVCEVCLWLADDDETRRRGLMGVTDLGDAVGMAFRWDEPRTGNFFMFQTPTPLSIAWFDASGTHVGQADMEPCLVEDSTVCERYTADSPYVLAVEMFGGQLDAVGIGPGSTVELLDLPCA